MRPSIGASRSEYCAVVNTNAGARAGGRRRNLISAKCLFGAQLTPDRCKSFVDRHIDKDSWVEGCISYGEENIADRDSGASSRCCHTQSHQRSGEGVETWAAAPRRPGKKGLRQPIQVRHRQECRCYFSDYCFGGAGFLRAGVGVRLSPWVPAGLMSVKESLALNG